MKRKISERFRKWKDDPDRKALMVTGCRQVGKTYSLTEFLKETYSSYLVINLERERDICEVFCGKDLSAENILDQIMILRRVKLIPGRSAIFFDEIQSCMNAYSSLKSLVTDGRFDIVASGSLLGVRMDDLQGLSPLGYVDTMEMYPMDFEEYLWAMGMSCESTEKIRRSIDGRTPFPESVLSGLNDMYRRYLAVGGMPDAVKHYSETSNYAVVSEHLKRITQLLEADSERYSKGVGRMRIMTCFESIPSQLASDVSKYRYYQIEKRKGAGKREYFPSVMWLVRAGLVIPCTRISEPKLPLAVRADGDCFRLYVCDTGILTSMLGPGTAAEVILRDPYSNNGSVMENAVACALRAKGYGLYYYKRDHSTLEIDFIIDLGGRLTALEVKSGRNRKAKSLYQLFAREKAVERAVKISEGNIFVDENGIENYPLFSVCFFPDADSADDIPSSAVGSELEKLISDMR